MRAACAGRWILSIKRAGFTLMELMVVVTIVGLVAAFAIPDYTKSVEKTHLKDAQNNLMLIHAAQQMYFAQNNNIYWPGGAGAAGALAAINSGLGLNIIANGMTYSCSQTLTTNFTCTAVRTGATAFTVTITEAAVSLGTNPSCTAGACP